MTSTPARILIADGCPTAATEENARFGGRPYGEIYASALLVHQPGLEFFVLGIAEGARLPQGIELRDFDGIAITGSPLSAYDAVPAVTRQIDFARSAFKSGVPVFGSCWGLQIMSAALGGEVRANPKGYEIGIARRIATTAQGHDHAMYHGKPQVFDAIAIHRDEVCRLPAGATVLATNQMSGVQAVEFTDADRSFWGVQYHPEFDLAAIAALLAKLEKRLVADGLAATTGDVRTLVADYKALHADPGRRDLAWRYGLGPDVLEAGLRGREFANWLATKVADRASVRHASA